MRIIITNAYSLEQKGDSALLIGTIKQLKLTFPGSHIQAQVTAHTKPGMTYEGAGLFDSITYIALAPDLPKYLRPIPMIYTFFVCILWAWFSRLTGQCQRWLLVPRLHRSAGAMWESDLVVPVAGGYLTANPGLMPTVNLIFTLLPIWTAHALHKPVIHFAQSIGPLGNNFQRFIVSRTLARARLVVTRESLSTKYARDLGVSRKKIAQSMDVGFLFPPEPGFNLADALPTYGGPSPGRPVVGITTKEHLADAPQALYEHELAEFCDWLIAGHGAQVVFVPQITSRDLHEDDRIINRRIRAVMRQRTGAFLIEKNLTNYQTKAVIEQLDYMVGTRFHGVIFALTGYVPSIAIEYEHKTSGIMRDLGLSEWIISMNDVTASKLSELFVKLDHQRHEYLETLNKKLPNYLAQAVAIREVVRSAYYGRSSRNGRKTEAEYELEKL